MSFKDTSSLSTSVMHLLHRAGQVADEYFAEEMKNSDLTPRQYAVLAILSERETASQTDIVNATALGVLVLMGLSFVMHLSPITPAFLFLLWLYTTSLTFTSRLQR